MFAPGPAAARALDNRRWASQRSFARGRGTFHTSSVVSSRGKISRTSTREKGCVLGAILFPKGLVNYCIACAKTAISSWSKGPAWRSERDRAGRKGFHAGSNFFLVVVERLVTDFSDLERKLGLVESFVLNSAKCIELNMKFLFFFSENKSFLTGCCTRKRFG